MASPGVAWCVASLGWLAAEAGNIVNPDTHWSDTQGNRIEAHAAGMLQSPLDGRWYWYGETKKTGTSAGVNCYSADTIAGPWSFEGQVFAQDMIRQGDSPGPFIVERPKVLYNNRTRRFVMWFHLDTDRYKYRHVGVAQAEHPVGPWTYVHGMRPDGIGSLDMSLFRDPLDSQAYFVRSCDNRYVGISRLTEDYLNTTALISTYRPVREGMALLRHPNGTYYMMTSHLSGWNPNPLVLLRAEGETLDDPRWVDMGNPTGSPTSFNSQPTYIVEYTPAGGAPYYVYMGDDWVHCPNADGTSGPLINACYVWLPLRFCEHNVSMEFRGSWDLDDPFATLEPCAPPRPADRLPVAPAVIFV